MLPWVLRSRFGGPAQCKAVFLDNSAVGVLIPIFDHRVVVRYEAVLFVKKEYRRTGIGSEVVKELLRLSGDASVNFHPCDLGNSKFFSGLRTEGVLTDRDFNLTGIEFMETAKQISAEIKEDGNDEYPPRESV